MITFRTNISLFRSFAIALTAVACATSTRSGPATRPDKPFVHSIWQIIAAPEIAGACELTNAFDLIASRRPQYLTDPSQDTHKRLPPPAVYINGAPAGDIATLSLIPVSTLVEVRYLPPRDAVTGHGQASAGGEILLYTYDPKTTAPRPCSSPGRGHHAG